MQKRNRFEVVWFTSRGGSIRMSSQKDRSLSFSEMSKGLRRAADMIDKTAEAEADALRQAREG